MKQRSTIPNAVLPVPSDAELPAGWGETTLDRLLVALESGSRPKGGVRGIADGVPSVGAEHLNADGGFRFENIKYVPETFYSRMSRGIIHCGDVLVVKDGATTGKVALVRSDFPYHEAAVNEHVFVCRHAKGVESAFLFLYLFSKEGQERILENFQGSAQGGINQGFAPGTVVPLAPLAEQKRIVAKVEELLARVNAARERLAKVPAILKRFRQSVLAAACSGRLTEEWRTANPAPEITNHQISDLPDSPELSEVPGTWRWEILQALCDPARSICYGVIKLGAEHVGGIPCLRTSDVKPLRIDTTGVKRIKPAISNEYQRTLLRGGEVLVNVRGTLGGVAVVPPELIGWNISREVAVVPIVEVEPRFIAFWIASMPCQNWLTGVAKGVAYTGINIEDLRLLPVALPPLPEQHEIVRRVSCLFALADSIEKQVAAGTARAEKLTQAILAKAFRGELVPTEADLARQEGRDYEPAEVLLQRITTKTAKTE